MKIRLNLDSEEITEWDNVDEIVIELELADNSLDTFHFTRPEEETKFYPQEEMTQLGAMLVASEARVSGLFLMVTGYAKILREEANKIANSSLSS